MRVAEREKCIRETKQSQVQREGNPCLSQTKLVDRPLRIHETRFLGVQHPALRSNVWVFSKIELALRLCIRRTQPELLDDAVMQALAEGVQKLEVDRHRHGVDDPLPQGRGHISYYHTSE